MEILHDRLLHCSDLRGDRFRVRSGLVEWAVCTKTSRITEHNAHSGSVREWLEEANPPRCSSLKIVEIRRA